MQTGKKANAAWFSTGCLVPCNFSRDKKLEKLASSAFQESSFLDMMGAGESVVLFAFERYVLKIDVTP